MSKASRPRRASDTPQVRCAIYTRKSSEEGLEQNFNSLHAQREACEAYVLSQAGEGWRALPTIYDDGGYSGGNTDRPALARLLADVDAGRIDTVVVYKVDRLTRSLADFAKIVDRFDAQGVSFVSVTQAFNTTSSMGRLTLNVLLSFAQFEREVTGERIRDKIAASKAKGMWMGGPLPLGYDAKDKALVVNPVEAEQVRAIFRRYLELGSVHALRAALEAEGARSKVQITRAGKTVGGAPFGRGALFHMLSNRLYVGEVAHKDLSYPGLHEPIVDRELFDAVQAALGVSRERQRAKRAERPSAALIGKVFDDRGNPMSPVTAKRNGRGYRYLVSSAQLTGQRDKAGSLSRLPVANLESILSDRLGRIQDAYPITEALVDRVRRIEVAIHRVTIDLEGETTAPLMRRIGQLLPPDDRAVAIEGGVRLTIAARLRPRGGVSRPLGPNGMPAVEQVRQDPALVRALVRAEAWKHHLLTKGNDSLEQLHNAECLNRSYAARLMRLALMSPMLKRAILEGKSPPGLTLQNLMTGTLPLSWSEQEAVYRPLPGRP